jgi:predicted ester cyclase
MGVEENKRLVARAVAAVINGGDVEAVDALYAPDVAEAAKEWVTPFRTAFPDVRMETVALVGEGDTVVGHFRCSGTQTGPWRGRPATGRAFRDVREVYWFTVRDGLIVDWWGLEDDDDRRRQLRAPT